MDTRFSNHTIFDKRKTDWNLDIIKQHVDNIFKNVSLLENWSFIKSEWSSERKSQKEELKRSIFKTLKIYIMANKKEVVYSIQVPELIYDQFFYIGGMLKLPIFQLYDYPIIYRNNSLRYKNNVMYVKIEIDKKLEAFKTQIVNNISFKKNIPFALLVAAYYSQDDFDIVWDSLPKKNNVLASLKTLCETYWETYTQNELTEMLGDYRVSNINAVDREKKGKSILFSLKTAPKIDFFTSEFMKTECIIHEILLAMSEGHRSDLDLQNKRTRMTEYILSGLMKTVYELICTMNFSKKVKFKISQSLIMDMCNVSDIIHYNFPYNPIGEIASLMQCSMTGPGSFKKQNVPSHLKDIHISQKGRICPADTPDRDGCGVILNMVPSVNLNDNGTFGKESPYITSFPISLTPFIKNNDQTRLQMASSQIKQSLLLNETELPIIATGSEDKYLEYTTFKHVARMGGYVMHIDKNFMVIMYDDNDIKMLDLGWRSLYLNGADLLETKFSEGDAFSEGDILVQSKFIKNDQVALGRNLLTGVAIWEGFNYEDGIIVSDETAEKFKSVHTVNMSFEIQSGQILLSLNHDNYKPLPEIGECIKRGEVYAKIKHISVNEVENLNIEPEVLTAQEDIIITNIEIFANTWNKQIPQFNMFVQNMVNSQTSRIENVRKKLTKFLTPKEIDRFLSFNMLSSYEYIDPSTYKNLKNGRYMEKGNSVTGVYVKISGIYYDKLGVGDKICNRMGNKGVISKIVPKDLMPTLPDGRNLDIIINPLGIISRMNAGQLYELHLTEAIYNMNKQIEKMKNNNKTKQEINDYITKVFKLIDKTPKEWGFKKSLKLYKKNGSITQIYQPAFQSISPHDLEKIIKLTKSKYKYELYNPEKKHVILNPIACGYMYFMKLIHRSSNKLIARSIGPYNKNTMQPVGGKKNMGGHRLGEMEIWALIAHGATNLIKDFLTTQSDSPKKKNILLSKILQNPELSTVETMDDRPQSFRLLEAYLKTLGLEIKNEG